jgi:DNA repair exonuclease SbcCD ATPase subunit
VSVDLQEPLGGVESAGIALQEFHATQDEFSEFFGDVFDQLQCLSLELFARHKCLEVSTERKAEADQALAGVREEFHRTFEELQHLHGQLLADREETQQSWGEIRAGYQRFLDDHADLREIREGFRQITAEFSGVKEDVQRERNDLQALCANVEGQLSRLSALTAELADAQSRAGGESQVAGILEHTKQQQAEWLQQRSNLEAELEAMRRRAAQQAEALSEQKRLAGQQQAELAGELKRMRSLLEVMSAQVRGEPVIAGEPAKPASENSVLGSVLAQFEMLQRDIASRRSKRNNEPDSGSRTFAGQ